MNKELRGLSDITRAVYEFRDALRNASTKAYELAEKQKNDPNSSAHDVYHSVKEMMSLNAKERHITRLFDISPA